MALLDSKADDGFQLLLMTPKPMIQAFDHITAVSFRVIVSESCCLRASEGLKDLPD